MTVADYAFGPDWLPEGGVNFQLWSPSEARVSLRLGERAPIPMKARAQGWHEVEVPDARGGERYAFELADGTVLPDPASRFQPEDVHGWSELQPSLPYTWAVPWQGRPWEELVICELHVGTFTPEGTFRAVIEKLDHLASVGITAIELMPIADFPGTRGWGYDGVFLYAPESSYGRPDDLRALVDAAHERGIVVLLDVVYNHFGPEGNHLPRLAPAFFTKRHHTPWGSAINFDGEHASPVREFFIQNALYWLREFNLDGLRLDAVHAIRDASEQHMLDEIALRVRASIPDRQIHLVLENEENETPPLAREAGVPTRFTAQWNDDVHHALHVAATGEKSGYYGEYLGNNGLLARSIAEGFGFQGEVMQFRGRARGHSSKELPPSSFVSFLQNHDQIGNRAFGERLSELATPQALRAVAAVQLLLPQIPMLFMGEEWGAAQPFYYFCDFHDELAKLVRAGRRNEFKRFPEFADEALRERIPDPQAVKTFEDSKLRWEDRALPANAATLRWYQRILTVRRAYVAPLIPGITRAGEYQILGDGALFVRWSGAGGRELQLCANLGSEPVDCSQAVGRVIWHEGNKPIDHALAPWTVRWLLQG